MTAKQTRNIVRKKKVFVSEFRYRHELNEGFKCKFHLLELPHERRLGGGVFRTPKASLSLAEHRNFFVQSALTYFRQFGCHALRVARNGTLLGYTVRTVLVLDWNHKLGVSEARVSPLEHIRIRWIRDVVEK